jgi:molecular chaperone DnaK (HSP70)
MLEIENDGRTMPSVVSFIPSNNSDNSLMPSLPTINIQWQWPTHPYQILTGNQALQSELQHPQSTYRNFKRVIGTGGYMALLSSGVVPNLFVRSSNEEGDKSKRSNKFKGMKKKVPKWKRNKSDIPKLHKQLEEAGSDPALLAYSCDSASYDGGDGGSEVLLRPEQISACILRKLYDTAERYHQQQQQSNSSNSGGTTTVKVTRAVIGVPAYFTESQRQATIRASELAGVPKVKLLPEPEAAALAYGVATTGSDSNDEGVSQFDKEELILVFDLGGGTFDVSILEVGGGVTEVIATVGNNRLGGTDFDKRVAEYLSSCAVEFGRKRALEDKMGGAKHDEFSGEDSNEKRKPRKRRGVKDWYRQGSAGIPDVILRVAEEARKALSNQKVVEILVPLTEEGWKQVGESDIERGGDEGDLTVIGPFDTDKLEGEYGMLEGEDYSIVELNRKTFEEICYNELQLLLQPIREVAIMAGVLLPGEARPSFVENALEMARAADEANGEDFWDMNDEDNEIDEPVLLKTCKGAPEDNEDALNEQALEQINTMDLKAQKKAQQRGRKKARDIDKRERSFRKQKQSAMEEATTASLLGTTKKQKGKGGSSYSPPPMKGPVSVGNEKVQDGIHGRPLSRIVLVGGATRMPVIGKLLEAVVGMVPQRTVHPDEAVALGCAVQVGILDGENEGLLGGMQAVLSPMQAAVMRALAKKRGMEMIERDDDDDDEEWGGGEMAMVMGGGSMGGISGLVVDSFDDEDDFY